jgi:hypothetical protein
LRTARSAPPAACRSDLKVLVDVDVVAICVALGREPTIHPVGVETGAPLEPQLEVDAQPAPRKEIPELRVRVAHESALLKVLSMPAAIAASKRIGKARLAGESL